MFVLFCICDHYLGQDTQEMHEETRKMLLAGSFMCRDPKDQKMVYA
jgi:hypothetical protein